MSAWIVGIEVSLSTGLGQDKRQMVQRGSVEEVLLLFV